MAPPLGEDFSSDGCLHKQGSFQTNGSGSSKHGVLVGGWGVESRGRWSLAERGDAILYERDGAWKTPATGKKLSDLDVQDQP